nr:carbamoyl-phosphate synthase large subunit [Desulfovibrionaceae bacterium]
MPRRSDIHTILVLGSGPIIIGQACEFDYSGTQACKALKEEGYRVVVINSNPATIMTDPTIADAVYIEPIEVHTIEEIIKKEKPDALLPIMGGQTALNMALQLDKKGILEKYGIELLGVQARSIEKAEDRKLFDEAMHRIGLSTPRSRVISTMAEGMEAIEEIGFPVIIRPSFTLGGTGGGIAYNIEEFIEICKKGLELSPVSQVLIDESLIGWKEMEMEVMRDSVGNTIIVCSIENFDPMGIHTGDSITVAPAITLTDKEYQRMRDMSIAVLNEIGVETGGSNVQFAINPIDGRIVVIEMNPRVSRSSALASKATGFPIAKVAAKLAVGYTLDELQNEITSGTMPASFEPTIDYVVVKIPRFTFEKFPRDSKVLSTQMKSIGEVMSIGGTFVEALQKALSSMENGWFGLQSIYCAEKSYTSYTKEEQESIANEIYNALSIPTADRILIIGDAFRIGMSVEEVHKRSHITPWFLYHIESIITEENRIREEGLRILSDSASLHRSKRYGFSDQYIGWILGISEKEVRKNRYALGIHPSFRRVDSCAGEFSSKTSYIYSTYYGSKESTEVEASNERSIIILGSGPNRIGQGLEFDYCCVHASLAVRESGYRSILINCNPETVSTDFDVSDALYFEPVTIESVLEVIAAESAYGVILQMGGQTPLKLARTLEEEGVRCLGTQPESIFKAEDRKEFSALLSSLGLLQPKNETVATVEEALFAAKQIGYPVIVRPSFVLGGRGMQVVYSDEQLQEYMREAISISEGSQVLVERFLEGATEVDIDVISDGTTTIVGGILEHIEGVGIHSGDSMCSFPPHSLSQSLQDELKEISSKIASTLGVIGLMNIQVAIYNGEIYVIEVNPRASRTIPFISKCLGHSLAGIATKAMLGISFKEQGVQPFASPSYHAVKVPVFPFDKFLSSDIILGPEMRSTGEVMGIGATFGEAMYKGFLGVHTRVIGPSADKPYLFFSIGDKSQRKRIAELARFFIEQSFSILATQGTATLLEEEGIPVERVHKVSEGRPNIIDYIKNKQIVLVVNIIGGEHGASKDAMILRRNALQEKIPCILTMEAAEAFIKAWQYRDSTGVSHLRELY